MYPFVSYLSLLRNGDDIMLVQIDFNSDEAIYQQLRNQIILGIACSQFQEGDNLPSVRELAEDIGINMHTVNKAYSVLKQEGYLTLDRRRGAVISINVDKYEASMKLLEEMKMLMAQAVCKGLSREEIHQMVDQIFDIYKQ